MNLNRPVTTQSDYEMSLQIASSRLIDARTRRPPLASREDIGNVIRAVASVGGLDLGFLTEDGFRSGDITRVATTARILASQSAVMSTIYAVNVVFGGMFLSLMGTPEQRALLPKVCSGDCQLAFALTEPSHGSDAAGIQAKAEMGADGCVLNGEKIFATGSHSADYILVVARTNDCADSPRALTIFMVPAGAPGLTVEPLPKLGGNEFASCRLKFDDVVLPDSAILGGRRAIGKAWTAMRETGAMERLTIAAEATGLAGAIVGRAVAYARERRQFGQQISSFQVIKHALVDIKTIQVSMRLMVERAVAAMEEQDDATEEVCMAKYYCAERLQEIAAMGMRVLGGRAYFEFEEMARFYRDAPLSLYAGGTIEIQKNLIARAMQL